MTPKFKIGINFVHNILRSFKTGPIILQLTDPGSLSTQEKKNAPHSNYQVGQSLPRGLVEPKMAILPSKKAQKVPYPLQRRVVAVPHLQLRLSLGLKVNYFEEKTQYALRGLVGGKKCLGPIPSSPS